jgi:hypothetical protein
MRARSSLVVAAVAFTLALAPGVAHAAPDEAEQLFDRGHLLMEKNSTLDEACVVLQKSYALAERGDTLLNLAECHRRQGKTASAWSEFDHAIRVGMKVKFPEAVTVATQLRDELATKLSRVRVEVPPAVASLEGLTLEVNGKPWPKASWNKAVIHDPGPLEIVATAKGYQRFTAQVDLGKDKDEKAVAIALEPEPKPVVVPPPPPPPTPYKAPIWPWIVGGAGVALSVAAVVFEIDSRSAGGDIDSHCGGGTLRGCPRSYDFSSARARETRGFDLFVGLGAAGVAAMGVGLGFGLALRHGPSGERTGLVLGPTSATLEQTF